MMKRLVLGSMGQGCVLCLLVVLLIGQSCGIPIVPHQADPLPIPLVPELGSRLSTLSSRLQEPRLPLPSPQELEAIKKVAQILVMLGEQVIPAIIGELPPPSCSHTTNIDVPNDEVNEKLIQ